MWKNEKFGRCYSRKWQQFHMCECYQQLSRHACVNVKTEEAKNEIRKNQFPTVVHFQLYECV